MRCRAVGLPFHANAEKRVTCLQGNNVKTGTHHGAVRYAFDFQLSEGTEILAAEDGVVVVVEVLQQT